MSSSTLSERDMLRVGRFDLVLEHSDGGGGYDGTGCLPCLPWCREPVYTPGQHITGYLLIRPVRRITITGVKICFEGVYSTQWTDRSLKWRGRRNFYTECVHLIRGRIMELDTKWYRFDFEHVLPKSLQPSFKTQHCRVSYVATGLITQLVMVDLHSYETGFQIQGPVDIRNLPTSFHQCVSKSGIQTYQTLLTSESKTQLDYGRINSIRDLNEDGLGNGVKSAGYSREGEESEDRVGGAWNRVSMALWINKQALTIGEELRVEVHIDNNTSITMEAMVQFEQVFVLRSTCAIFKRTSEFVPLGMLAIKKIHSTQATIWHSQIGPTFTETKSMNYVIPKVFTNITPPSSDSMQSSLAELSPTPKERDPLIKIQYFVRLKVKPKDDTIMCSTNQSAQTVSIEIKVGNCDTGVHHEDTDIVSSCGFTNSVSNRPHSSTTCSDRTSNRKQSAITCSRHTTMVSEASNADLLNNLDGSEESVFDLATFSQRSDGYTPDTEGPPAYRENSDETQA